MAREMRGRRVSEGGARAGSWKSWVMLGAL